MSENKINYDKIIERHPWIVEKNQDCILSPDSDGFLCGLLMSSYLDWNIVGFYDGKNLLLKEGLKTKNCVFLDIEILRKDIRSVGHHMNIHNFSDVPNNFHDKFSNCINPNYIRRFDRAHNFSQKYPLGSIHLLLYILETKYPEKIKIKDKGLGALFFADGVWKILFKYTENILDWFDYLHSNISSIWWEKLKELSVIDLIEEIDSLLHKFSEIHPENKRWYGHIDLSNFENQKDLLFNNLKLLSDILGWQFKKDKWNLTNLKKYQFTKEIFDGSRSNIKFFAILNKNPLSLAMTEGSTIQYTLERPDKSP